MSEGGSVGSAGSWLQALLGWMIALAVIGGMIALSWFIFQMGEDPDGAPAIEGSLQLPRPP